MTNVMTVSAGCAPTPPCLALTLASQMQISPDEPDFDQLLEDGFCLSSRAFQVLQVDRSH